MVDKFISIKRLILFILCVITFATGNAQLKQRIEHMQVDSVIVKAIDRGATTCYGYTCYDRTNFDFVFDFLKNDSHTCCYKSKYKTRNEIILFLAMLNNVEPFKEEDINVYPNDIHTKSGTNWLREIPQQSEYTNDETGTYGKITIYMKDKSRIEAFLGRMRNCIDIFNYRYEMGQELISGLFPYPYIYMENYDSDAAE